jgi:hypothetical protein
MGSVVQTFNAIVHTQAASGWNFPAHRRACPGGSMTGQLHRISNTIFPAHRRARPGGSMTGQLRSADGKASRGRRWTNRQTISSSVP